MFDGLDGVAWKKLKHSYGPATDVPGLIRGLRSPSEPVRARARYFLDAALLHQGTPFPSAPAAMPWMIEAVAAPDTPDRGALWVPEGCGGDPRWVGGGMRC